jgi:hypothetical protein
MKDQPNYPNVSTNEKWFNELITTYLLNYGLSCYFGGGNTEGSSPLIFLVFRLYYYNFKEFSNTLFLFFLSNIFSLLWESNSISMTLNFNIVVGDVRLMPKISL